MVLLPIWERRKSHRTRSGEWRIGDNSHAVSGQKFLRRQCKMKRSIAYNVGINFQCAISRDDFITHRLIDAVENMDRNVESQFVLSE
jgi:hypothetical protein